MVSIRSLQSYTLVGDSTTPSMSHFLPSHTPEKLLGRNDSKNPATTCKGITGSGRACRRALASPKSSPIGRRRSGLVAVVEEDGEVQEADFYCFQHKDQAVQRVAQEDRQNAGRRVKKRSTELFTVRERSSIDTMVQKLGISAIPEEPGRKPERKPKEPKPPRGTETQDFAAHPQTRPSAQAPYREKYDFDQPAKKTKTKKPGFWASLCCMSGSSDDDYVEIVRHRQRVEPSQPPPMTSAAPPRIPPNKPISHAARPASAPALPRKPVSTTVLPVRPASQYRASSNPQTNQLLSTIPQHLSPQTTSALFAELIKPISPADEEGYIYIFWLTPQTKDAPAESDARSLLSPGRPQHGRRVSDVMTEYSFSGSEPETRNKKTIMLKIGRANNITRRMNEWQRQCGYALNLVRWYPYISSSATPTPQPSPSRPTPLYPDLSRPAPASRRESGVVRKVPYVKRVERLIHIELQEKQVKRQCEACGKEHREWFEVEASQVGVRGVDECVRRWVGWAEEEVRKAS